jgi:hypothetical protein
MFHNFFSQFIHKYVGGYRFVNHIILVSKSEIQIKHIINLLTDMPYFFIHLLNDVPYKSEIFVQMLHQNSCVIGNAVTWQTNEVGFQVDCDPRTFVS